MRNLFSIEYFKIKKTRYFWVLSSFYLLSLLMVGYGSKLLMDYLGGNLGDFIKMAQVGAISTNVLYDFTDLWHNLSYLAGFLKFVLAFILIISVSNEFSYKTVRQNIMDGMSRTDWLKSKWLLILLLATGSTLFLFIFGLFLGFMYSPVQGVDYVFFNIEMLLGHFLSVITYLSFALLAVLLFRKSGFTMAVVILYGHLIEPIFGSIYSDELGIVRNLLPFESVANIVRFPFGKHFFQETQNYLAIQDVTILLGFLILSGLLCLRIVKKRDF